MDGELTLRHFEQTDRKWRKRDSMKLFYSSQGNHFRAVDRVHTAYRPQKTLTSVQEAVAVALRKTLLVSFGDLLAFVVVLEPMARKACSESF